jgi:hypothetical protein
MLVFAALCLNMNSAMAEAGAKPSAASVAEEIDGPKSLRFTLDPNSRIYPFKMAYEAQVMVSFPVACRRVWVGNTAVIQVMIDQELPNVVNLTARPEAQVGQRTNVTVLCEQNVRASLDVQVVGDMDQGAQIVEFDWQSEYLASMAAAVRSETTRMEGVCTEKLAALERKVQASYERELMTRIEAGVVSRAEREAEGVDGLVVKIDRVVQLGEPGRGYMTFRIHNLTGESITIGDIELSEDDDDGLVVGDTVLSKLALPHRLGHTEEVETVIGFPFPDGLRSFRLTVRDSRGRETAVGDIDF